MACTMARRLVQCFFPLVSLAASASGFVGTNRALLHPHLAAQQGMGARCRLAGYNIPRLLVYSKAFKNNNHKEPSRRVGLVRTFAQLSGSGGSSARNTGDASEPGVPAIHLKQALLQLLSCDRFCFFAVEDEHIRIKEARSVLLLICWAS